MQFGLLCKAEIAPLAAGAEDILLLCDSSLKACQELNTDATEHSCWKAGETLQPEAEGFCTAQTAYSPAFPTI